MRIDIDFIGGSHGNYLEFVLTKLMFPTQFPDTPFNSLGASHNKFYTKKVFFARHYFQSAPTTNNKVISVQFTDEDLLQLMSISLLRAGDMNILDTELHINTYQKLNNKFYRSTLDNIISSYSPLSGYSDINADSWPAVQSVEEFYQLPQWIQDECATVYGFSPHAINESSPDISRAVLREFFKFGFLTPEKNGFTREMKRMQYSAEQQVFKFPYNCFYNTKEFVDQLAKVQQYFNLEFSDYNPNLLHSEFLNKQLYKNLKQETNDIIEKVKSGGDNIPLNLTLFQESYINAKLEEYYKNIKMPLKDETYFKTTKEIYNFIHEI